jgi:hypothetical protein
MTFIDDLIPKLKGLRTRIVYDSHTPRDILFYHHVLPCFLDKKIFLAVYSDTISRRLRKRYEDLSRTYPNIASILDRIHIIKIGQKENIPYGKSYEFISEDDPSKALRRLKTIFEKLGNDVLIFSGFSMLIAIGGHKILNDVFSLFDSLPENITLLDFHPDGFYDEQTNKLMEKLYDVIIKIKREEEYMEFGETTYLAGVEQSIISEIEPGFTRFKVKDGRLVE